MENPYAWVPTDINGIVRLVKREAAEECVRGSCLVASVLDQCVEEAVTELWDSRVKTYVPLLALRRVRCCIRTGSCDCGEC